MLVFTVPGLIFNSLLTSSYLFDSSLHRMNTFRRLGGSISIAWYSSFVISNEISDSSTCEYVSDLAASKCCCIRLSLAALRKVSLTRFSPIRHKYDLIRSEDLCVGKECVLTFSSRWSP